MDEFLTAVWRLLSHGAAVLHLSWGVVGVALGLFLTASSIYFQGLYNKNAKRADVAMRCTERYERLRDTRGLINKLKRSEKEYQLNEYWGKFWSIKSDQFDYWLFDLIDYDTFNDWCFYLTHQFRSDLQAQDIGLPTLTSSWGLWKGVNGNSGNHGFANRGGANPRFVRFTNNLEDLARQCVAKEIRERTSVDDYIQTGIMKLFDIEEGTFFKPGSTRKFRRMLFFVGLNYDNYKKLVTKDML